MRFFVLVLFACHARQPDVVATANAYQPQLVVLSLRVAALKHELRGNLPGWQDMFRLAQLANDELGLWPFEQTSPPGPGWQPSPATLLGMKGRLATLASTADLDADARVRYQRGIASVDARLTQLEDRLSPYSRISSKSSP